MTPVRVRSRKVLAISALFWLRDLIVTKWRSAMAFAPNVLRRGRLSE